MGRLAHQTLRENAVNEIRMKILNRELKPGMRIVEQKLVEEFGISHGPIREALRQLEQEGLVEYVRNVGCSVREIKVEDIYEIYLLRSIYEIIAVQLCGGKFSTEDISRMDEVLELMKEADPEKDMDEELAKLSAYDSRFHKIIVEKAGFKRLTKAWEELGYGNIVSFYAGEPDKKEGILRQYPLHSKLAKVCRTGNEEEICSAVSEHYMKTVNRLMREGHMSGEVNLEPYNILKKNFVKDAGI